MKRCWFGAGLLIALLAAALAVTWAVSRCHCPIARDLEQASQAVLREDWAQAESLIQSAEARWQQYWPFSASVSDHSPMESIDSLFAQLSTCLKNRDSAAAASICAELARQVEAIAEAHRPSWWNLL